MMRDYVVALLVLAALAAMLLSAKVRNLAFHVAFGWVLYLRRVLPEVTVRWDGVIAFLIGVAIFTLLLHGIAVWLRREMSGHATVWRWRSTLLLVGVIVMTFTAGIAMVGVTHQTVWLVRDDEPLMVPVLPPEHNSSHTNLGLTGMGVLNMHDIGHQLTTRLPIGSEEVEQSWVTNMLPGAVVYSDLDRGKPWDHLDNQLEIRKLVPILLNPGLRPIVLRDENGYGVTHYAGNTHLFDHPGPFSLKDISDGSAHTLMIGEINANFPPWAKPRANRDPALGINRTPDGFGGPAANGGALFVMADGSVKFVSRHTSPAVLKALATPSGDEPMDDSVLER